MDCPVCGGAMYDNRTTKKNPKGPDYRCKDKNCKYQLDQETGEYVESQYGTGVWLKKTTPAPRPAPAAARPAARPGAPAVRPNVPEVKREMVMSYAKDLIVAQINGGQPVETPVKSIIFAYRLMLKEVQAPGSVIFKGDQEASPEPGQDPADQAGYEETFAPEGEDQQ